jgi:hypothetical protein
VEYLGMSVHLPEERKSSILQELKKSMKRIKFKKCTPCQVDRETISFSNPIFASLPIPQTIIGLPEYQGQQRRLGYISPMGIQDDWRNQMVAKNHENQQTSSYLDQSNISSNNNNRCIPNNMGSNFSNNKTKHKNKSKKRNTKIITKKKDLVILSEKIRLYCSKNLKNTKWSYTDQIGLKLNQKLQKDCQITQQKWSNYMKKQTSNLKEITAIYLLSSSNKEVKNRQYSSNVQYQQEIGSKEFILHIQENLEIIRKKLIDIKSSTYSRKDKCDNGQTKLSRNEQRLSSRRKSIPKNSKDVEMLSKGRPVRIEKEQTNKEICVGDSKKRSRQYKKCLKAKLDKHKRSCSSTSADPSSTESIEEISRRRKDSYTDSSFLEGPSMDKLIKKTNYFNYSTKKIKKRVNQREGYGAPQVTQLLQYYGWTINLEKSHLQPIQ